MPKRPQAAPGVPTLPERLCPQHGVLMEPVGDLQGVPYYYCPKGDSVRSWRSIFKQAA